MKIYTKAIEKSRVPILAALIGIISLFGGKGALASGPTVTTAPTEIPKDLSLFLQRFQNWIDLKAKVDTVPGHEVKERVNKKVISFFEKKELQNRDAIQNCIFDMPIAAKYEIPKFEKHFCKYNCRNATTFDLVEFNFEEINQTLRDIEKQLGTRDIRVEIHTFNPDIGMEPLNAKEWTAQNPISKRFPEPVDPRIFVVRHLNQDNIDPYYRYDLVWKLPNGSEFRPGEAIGVSELFIACSKLVSRERRDDEEKKPLPEWSFTGEAEIDESELEISEEFLEEKSAASKAFSAFYYWSRASLKRYQAYTSTDLQAEYLRYFTQVRLASKGKWKKWCAVRARSTQFGHEIKITSVSITG